MDDVIATHVFNLKCVSFFFYERDLFQTFLDTMFTTGGDFTNCFRALSIIQYPKHSDFDASIEQFMSTIVEQCCDAEEWKRVHRSTMDDR